MKHDRFWKAEEISGRKQSSVQEEYLRLYKYQMTLYQKITESANREQKCVAINSNRLEWSSFSFLGTRCMEQSYYSRRSHLHFLLQIISSAALTTVDTKQNSSSQ